MLIYTNAMINTTWLRQCNEIIFSKFIHSEIKINIVYTTDNNKNRRRR